MSGQREQQREAQRARILEAARGLFAERGPHNVTMAEVALAAEVARATVFNHFGSKSALIEEITASVLAAYHELLDQALADTDTNTPAQIRSLFVVMGRGIEADRRFYHLVFREIAKFILDLEQGGVGQTGRQQGLERLVRLFARGQRHKQISRRHRPEDLAAAFDSLLFGTVTHWLYDDASEALPARLQRAAEIFLMDVETLD